MPITPQIAEWYDQFIQSMAEESIMDQTTVGININRASDRNRIVTLDANDPRKISNVLPEQGPVTDEMKEQLYNLAQEGNLFVYPLTERFLPMQVRPEKENMRTPLDIDQILQEYVKELTPPVRKELSFFKKILNLFGFFEGEKQQYNAEYESALKLYQQDNNQKTFMQTVHRNNFASTWRSKEMLANSETFRGPAARNMRDDIQNHLQKEELPVWRRNSMEARLRLVNGALEGGASYTDEEAHHIMTIMVLDEMVTKKAQLREQIENDPTQLQNLYDCIHSSQCVRTLVERNTGNQTAQLTALAFVDKPIDTLVGQFSQEMKDRQAAARVLVSEGKMAAVENSLAGAKALFTDPAVEERMVQLRNARSAVPESELKLDELHPKFLANWPKNKPLPREDRMDIPLDDPRILAQYNAGKAKDEAMEKGTMDIQPNVPQ